MGVPLSDVNRHPFGPLGDSRAMTSDRDIGVRLKYVRTKLRKLSQVELAAKAGITQASISDLERGKSRAFRGVTLIAVARVLKVSAEWLQHGKGPMEKQDIPLSDEAVTLAQAWQRLDPGVRSKIADMVYEM